MYTKLPGLEEVCAFRVLLASGITPDYAGSPECLLNNNLCGCIAGTMFSTGRMPFLSSNQRWPRAEGTHNALHRRRSLYLSLYQLRRKTYGAYDMHDRTSAGAQCMEIYLPTHSATGCKNARSIILVQLAKPTCLLRQTTRTCATLRCTHVSCFSTGVQTDDSR